MRDNVNLPSRSSLFRAPFLLKKATNLSRLMKHILTDSIISEVFLCNCGINSLHLITVHLHVHELQFIEILNWLFGDAYCLG